MTLVATPSFEAYRLYVQALRLFRAQMAGRKTLGLLRAAVALDPDFATAWTFMGIVYSDLAYPDSARACFERSWSRPDRLTDVQRRRLEVLRMTNDGDSRGALAACDQMLADDPNDWWALINSNDLLVVAGRIEEALQRTRTSMKVSPFGATTLSRSNLVTDLVLLTRFDEAREAASHMTGVYRANFLYFVERGANRWTVAESIAVCNLDDPRVNEDFPGLFLWLLGQTQLARGDLQVAKATLARSVAMSVAAQDAAGVKWDRLLLVEYAVVSSQALPLPPDAELRDTSATSVLTRGLAATATGDLAVARRSLAGLRSRSAQALALQGAGPTLLEARIATLAAQPADAVELLRPLAVARVDPGFPGVGVGLTWIRWSLADAFERLAKPDSAAAYLERVMSVPTDTEVWPFVHLRLTLLYARMGRVAEAERHLAAVESTWDRPEPAVRRMLNDARAAVTSARGMARPEAAGANVVAPDSGSRDVRGPGH
jgi:tetratricopeptide (TPR) repeat protein